MFGHMKNTIRDIKKELCRGVSAEEKVRRITFLIKMLESVECGEAIVRDMKQ